MAYKRVVVALDVFENGCDAVLRRALAIYATGDHIVPDLGAQIAAAVERRMRAAIDGLADVFGLSGERAVRRGRPADEIRAARDALSADLVVVGTHARRGVDRLLGSTANAVLHGAGSDVLAVRVAR